MGKKIFISYRRNDSAPWAGRIHQDLTKRFGRNRLFMDADTIRRGWDFKSELGTALRETRVMLVLIGPKWLTARSKMGWRRLDDPDDQVRIEIATALAGTIAVIPVLLEGQTMPERSELPDDLKDLSGRQAVSLSHANFPHEMDGLEADLKPFFRPAFVGARASVAASLAVVLALVGAQILPLMSNALGALTSALPRKVASSMTSTNHQTRGPTLHDRELERDVWANARADNSISAYQDYIRRYPLGADRDAAEQAIADLNDAEERKRLVESHDCTGAVETTVGGQHACLKPAQAFKDCATCPDMVVVPAGKFVMGASSGHAGSREHDRQVKRITLAKPIAIGKFAVTVGEFKRFAETQGVGTGCWIAGSKGARKETERTYANPAMTQTARHPAICVSWADANRYAAWLSRKTGVTYRLPSEAELEYATRANSTTDYYFGDDKRDLCKYANAADRAAGGSEANGCADGTGAQTAPVGELLPNAFGLHDMIGNAAQWAADCWQPNVSALPANGAANAASPCNARVARGGAWNSRPDALRSAARSQYSPDARDTVGFRVVRELGP